MNQIITTLPSGVQQWFQENQHEWPIRSVKKISVGQSNPTFIINNGDGDYILRCQPEGDLLPSAHAVDREYRIMSSLAETQVPVPKMITLITDRERYGLKFFIMEKIAGETLLDPALPSFTAYERHHFYHEQVNTLAALATLNPDRLGLSDFGKPNGYIDRQIAIWTKQYRAAETATIPAMEHLITALPGKFDDAALLPHGVVHGDFRQDNLLVTSGPEKTIAAVIDWELSTLGPVFVDLSYWCAMLRMHHSWAIGGLGGLDRTASNIPAEHELVSAFCDKTGLTKPDNWDYWIAFQLFRFAAILQGIKKRHLEGNASADNAEAVGAQAIPVAEMAQAILDSVT